MSAKETFTTSFELLVDTLGYSPTASMISLVCPSTHILWKQNLVNSLNCQVWKRVFLMIWVTEWISVHSRSFSTGFAVAAGFVSGIRMRRGSCSGWKVIGCSTWCKEVRFVGLSLYVKRRFGNVANRLFNVNQTNGFLYSEHRYQTKCQVWAIRKYIVFSTF